jgi:Tol biopolymer transport system component
MVALALTASLLLLAASPCAGASTKRVFRIACEPADATVQIKVLPENAAMVAMSEVSPPGRANGYATKQLKVSKGDIVEITLTRTDYESFTTNFTYEFVRNTPGNAEKELVISARLVELRREVPVQFEAGAGARFFTNDAPCPATGNLSFSRTNSATPWTTVMVRIERPDYKTLERSVSLADAEGKPLANSRRQLVFELEQTTTKVELPVNPNERDTDAFVNDKPAGKMPGKLTLVFERPDAATPWSTNVVRLEKAGYEYRPPIGVKPTAVFLTNLTLEATRALSGGLELPHFQPVRSFEVPLRRFVIARGEVTLEETNSVSAKDPNESNASLLTFGKRCDTEKGEAFLLGRIGATTFANSEGRAGEVVMSLAFREVRHGTNAEVVGSSLYLVASSGVRKRITDAEPGIFDIHPCVSKDGKYVFYSSNRRGQWGIWKKLTSGSGGLTPIDPARGIDVEPAVFSASDGSTRLAFTRYFLRAALNTPPRIVVQSEDGFAETERGRSPAWSPDGLRIAYVGTDNKIWVMDATGENPNQLTTKSYSDAAPCWLHDGNHLIYASAATAEEARNETGNFDIWMIDLEGRNPQALVSNPSFDSYPVSTWDGKKCLIYFVSNRGAQALSDEAWQIYYFEPRFAAP